jgi:hypothetical protein
MNDPFPIRSLSRDNANVVTPHDDHSNSRSSGVRAFAGPLSRERKTAVRFAEIPAHVISAPSVRSVRMLMSVIGASVGVDGERAQQSCRENGWLNHSVLQLQFGFIAEATKNRLSNARRDLWFRRMTPAIASRERGIFASGRGCCSPGSRGFVDTRIRGTCDCRSLLFQPYNQSQPSRRR